MVEHLAFRATTNFDKLELVKYLESIGASFGACQNAYTSFDETVYELMVPSDDEGLVNQSLTILHEWACRIRISDDDVECERGVVLEEWRAGRNAAGRMAEDYWRELTQARCRPPLPPSQRHHDRSPRLAPDAGQQVRGPHADRPRGRDPRRGSAHGARAV